MKATLIRNLQIGYGISLILLLISSVASYFSITNLLNSSKMVDHTNKVILKLESSLSTLKDAETGQRGFLLSNDSVFLQPYTGAYSKTLSTIDEVSDLTADNPPQQQRARNLKELVLTRLSILDRLIQQKKAKKPIELAQLREGKKYMDMARQKITEMEAVENKLLSARTASMNKFAAFTPLLVLIASLLSLIITIYSYRRVVADFKQREKLQAALILKDEEISSRIDIIQNIAEKIAAGDYTTRVNDIEKDGLGNLAISLNRMAESLEHSFNLLSAKEWLQTGIAGLNEKMVGEKDVNLLATDIVTFLSEYAGTQVAVLYTLEHSELLLRGSYSLPPGYSQVRMKLGEGIAGQCARSGRTITVTNIPESNIMISYGTGQAKPTNVLAFPITHNGVITGAVEMASVKPFNDEITGYLDSVAPNIGIAMDGARNRAQLRELFEETQAQSEELQAQHSEMENINAELEAQTQKLQASEEELRVQQEELQQANQELEERSRLLEEKNQLIIDRNSEIQRKAEELELSSKYKSEFLANMSHELRTPLNSILLLSRLMAENNDDNLSKDQVESAKVIQSSGKGLLALIDEILDLSKIESGKMELEYAKVNIKDITSNMKALFAPIATDKKVELIIETDNGLDGSISTDQLRLEQILKNLLSNALKFTASGSVKFSIAPSPGNKELIEFCIKDTGPGIPEAKQKIIFEAFQQADGSTKRKFGGTGLGLSISRELARLLGGDIRLTSTPGKGSEFTAVIPKLKPEGPVVAETIDLAPVIPEKRSSEVTPEPTRFLSHAIPADVPDDRNNLAEGDNLILIVEDDTNFAKALLDFTHHKGYKGIVSVRGDQATELALQYRPSAILLDIQLPVKDGWEVMEELKSNNQLRHIPVHIMSSLQVKKESLTKGAIDFISKPFAIEQMQDVFRKLEDALKSGPKKVLIVEENPKHAKALAYFLETFNISTEIKGSVHEGVSALKEDKIDCVILDMGIPDQNAYETLDTVKKNPGLENLPIIIFTGKNLSKAEENRIKQYADSIVVKTAHSYQRILDEISLFLHVIEDKIIPGKNGTFSKPGAMDDVLKDKTVLIADDDVRNIFSLTRSLEQHKMKVISAMDGNEALKQLDDNPEIDIVLMDMMMPELDGYETTTRIKKQHRYKDLPVLAVTAKAMLGDREKCIRAGASDYISKPVDIDQLVSLLRVWLYDKSF